MSADFPINTINDLQNEIRNIKAEYRDKIQALRVEENSVVNEILNNHIKKFFPIGSIMYESHIPSWGVQAYKIISYDDMYVYYSLVDYKKDEYDKLYKERKDKMIFKFTTK